MNVLQYAKRDPPVSAPRAPFKLIPFLLGKPLPTREMKHERLNTNEGLAVFSVDALSSTAYATEEILLVLVGGGLMSLWVSVPIAIAITVLIFIISFSYRQVIHAYPAGGGVYNVARANLGDNPTLRDTPALVGAASLMIDYVLTPAVSTAAGIAALTSAVPALYEHRVGLGILVIVGLTIVNLRGVRESGRLFMIPTFLFVAVFGGMFLYGAGLALAGKFPAPLPSALTDASPMFGVLGVAMVLRAFSSGCTAMTGIEAVSNGVQAFQAPESENASRTLMRMAVILGAIFMGITILAYYGGIRPKETETVVSQVARLLFGSSPFYYLVQASTMMILVLASNTPFAGFPQVASQLAKDGYFPHQFMNLGSKGVYTFGIVFLSFFAVALIVLFQGSVHALIPLYAVGVFLGFSLSGLGMVVHWKRQQGNHARHIAMNATGCVFATLVLLITFYAKFTHGAWMLVPAIMGIVWSMKRIKTHYDYMDAKQELFVDGEPMIEDIEQKYAAKTMVILISRINKTAIKTIRDVLSYTPKNIRVFRVCIDEAEIPEIKEKWYKCQKKGIVPMNLELEIVYNEFRNITAAACTYLRGVSKELDDETVRKSNLVIVLQEIIPPHWSQHLLHNQTALLLRTMIENDPDIKADILDHTEKIR